MSKTAGTRVQLPSRASSGESTRQSQERLETYMRELYERQKRAEEAPRLSDDKPLAAFEYLVFSAGGGELAVPLLSVRTVAAMPVLTPLPFMPPHFLGAFNLRGQIVSVVDLRRFFGTVAADPSTEAAVVVVQGQSLCMGLLVDAIKRVATVARPEELHPIRLLDPDETLKQVAA